MMKLTTCKNCGKEFISVEVRVNFGNEIKEYGYCTVVCMMVDFNHD